MTEPGLSTALQPTSAWSPRIAPNFRRPLLTRSPSAAFDHDLAVVELDVGKDRARAEVALVTQDRVADVIEMRHLRAVEQQAVLELARVAQHGVVAHDDVLAHVTTVADVAVRADPRRAFDHRAVLDDRAFAHEHVRPDVRLADQFALEHRGLQAELEISRRSFPTLPRRVVRVLEQHPVRGVFQVQVIGGAKEWQRS